MKDLTHITRIEYVDARAYGKFTLVGAVPAGCCDVVTADRAAIMSGRACWREDGLTVTYAHRYYATAGEARDAVQSAGGTLCAIPGCACRKHDAPE